MPWVASPVTVGSCQFGSVLFSESSDTTLTVLPPVALAEVLATFLTIFTSLKPSAGIVCSVPVANCTFACVLPENCASICLLALQRITLSLLVSPFLLPRKATDLKLFPWLENVLNSALFSA